MKRFKYPALVRTEAKNLRKFATKEELQQLSEVVFEPKSEFKCIYGMMTSTCFSPRASELIQKCAPRVYKKDDNASCNDDYLSKKLNGKPKQARTRFAYWSPIEVFIYPEKRKKAAIRLLKYLKGEIKTL